MVLVAGGGGGGGGDREIRTRWGKGGVTWS